MPARTLPTSFTAMRSFSMAGTAVAKGDVVTAKVAAQALRGKLGEVVSRGWLRPNTPLYPVTARRAVNVRTTPTYSLSAKELAALLA